MNDQNITWRLRRTSMLYYEGWICEFRYCDRQYTEIAYTAKGAARKARRTLRSLQKDAKKDPAKIQKANKIMKKALQKINHEK